MTPVQWFAVALGVEFILVTAIVVTMFVSGWWRIRVERRDESLVKEARAVLTRTVAGVESRPDDVRVLKAIGRERLTELVFEIASLLSTEDRKLLSSVLEETGLIERARRDIRSRFWTRRLRGIRVLAVTSNTSIRLPAMLRDTSEHVRAAAAQWVEEARTVEYVADVATMLGDAQPGCRTAAQNALINLGGAATEPIRLMLAADPRRALIPGLQVAVALGDPIFVEAAHRYAQHTDPEVRIVVAELLGSVGDAEEIQLLISMLGDRNPDVRSAVARAIGRTQDWRAAGALEKSLSDPEWEPRREAAIALTAIGSAGRLLLRQASASADPLVSATARQALELGATSG